MKRRIGYLLTLLLTAGAAPAGVVTEQVDKVIGNAGAWSETLGAIAAQGAAAVPELVELMRGDNAKQAKYAWRFLIHLTESAVGAEATAMSQALLGLLNPDGNPTVETRLIERVQAVAGAEAVPALVKLLNHPALAEPARVALAVIPAGPAREALLKAYETATMPGALRLAEALAARPDVDLAFFAALTRLAEPQLQALGARMLGQSGDAAWLETLKQLWSSVNAAVRQSALEAVLAIAQQQAAAGHDAAAAAIYQSLLSQKLEPRHLTAILSGLGRTAVDQGLPVAIEALGSLDTSVRSAAASLIRKVPAGDAAIALRQRLGTIAEEAKPFLLELMAEVMGQAAVPDLVDALAAGTEQARATALRLLGELGASEQAALVLDHARLGADLVRSTAIETYLKLAGRVAASGLADRAREMVLKAVDVARSDADRAAALRALAPLATAAMLPTVEPLLERSGAVKHAAGAVALAIATAQAAAGQKDEAIALAERVFRLGFADLSDGAAALLKRLGVTRDFVAEAGFIARWHAIGPFPNANNQAADRAWPPEQGVDLTKPVTVGGKPLNWQPLRVTDPGGGTNLAPVFSPNTNVACYLYAEVTVAQAGEALLLLGSDDGVVAWVNGEQVHKFTGNRGLAVDSDKIKVQLKAGTNTVLLKILQGGGGWGFAARLRSADGQPLEFTQPE